MNYLCDSKAIIKLAVMPPGRLLVAFVNASHFLLATATVGFHFSESYSTTARWMSSQRPWFVYNCFIDCHDGTCWRNLFCPQLRPSRDPTLQASTDNHLQYVSHVCQSSQINCSVRSPTENYRAKVPDGCSCSLSPRVSVFFFCEHTIRQTECNLWSMLWWMFLPRSSFKISV